MNSKLKDKSTLGYLGQAFQLKFLGQLLTDKKYASSVIDLVKPEYFDDEKIRCIVMLVKNNYEQYEHIPDYLGTEILIKKDTDGHTQEHCLALLDKSKELGLSNSFMIQDTAKIFFKQQETIKVSRQILKIAESGDTERYHECEDLLRKALNAGADKDEVISVFHDVDSVLSDDFREPIPTGIEGVDKVMNGGLSRGELAVVLAGSGVGKTTASVKICNTAKNYGCNVLQIFFEDLPKVIQRKHFSCWTGITLNELADNKELVKERVAEELAKPGILELKRMESGTTTVPMIKQYIKKRISEGFRPDLITIDYVDCITPSKNYQDNNVGEGAIMREIENMAYEFNIATWALVQGNRSTIGAELVEASQMGGSIKKAQIAHFIMSFAKTLDQRENSTGTIAILKSRFGKDGIVFRNCQFDNGKIQIETGEDDGGIQFSKMEEVKKVESNSKISESLLAAQAKKRLEKSN